MLTNAPAFSNFFDLIGEHAKNSPSSAVIFGAQEQTLTYRDLYERARETQRFFSQIGAQRTDRIAIVLPAAGDFATIFCGLNLRAILVPLSENLSQQEYAQIFEELDVSGLIISQDTASDAREAARAQGRAIVEMFVSDSNATGFVGFRCEAWESRSTTLPTTDDILLLMRSSGTTGTPKVVPISLTYARFFGTEHRTSLHLTAVDRGLILQPIYLAGGFGQFVACLLSGSSFCVESPHDIPRPAALIGSGEVTWFTALPATHRELLTHFSQHPALMRNSRLRMVRTGGTSIDPALAQQVEAYYQVPLVIGYGSTETGLMAWTEIDPAQNRPGSIGRPIFCEAAIINDDSEFLSAGELGEILIRGEGVFKSYLDPRDNDGAFFGEWYRTGDIGYQDSDGYLYLKGRKKELINRGGEKILPQDVLKILRLHPDITEAIVFAIPHPTLGEDVAAAVVLRPGNSSTDSDLRAHCAEHLTIAKTPKRILQLDALPKTLAGKIDVRAVRTIFETSLQVTAEIETQVDTLAIDRLALIFQEILGVEKIGPHDDFFLNGGDSLRTARLIATVEERNFAPPIFLEPEPRTY